MDILGALTAFAKAAEHEAEDKARDLVAALEAKFATQGEGLTARVAALETKIGTDAAQGLTTLGERVSALEKEAGLAIADDAVASAIAALTAPPPTATDAAVASGEAAQPAAAAPQAS